MGAFRAAKPMPAPAIPFRTVLRSMLMMISLVVVFIKSVVPDSPGYGF
jgi:hypothetical protein